MAEKMHRVRRDKPCPICGKQDWCLVAPDGSAAICPRVKEGSCKKCGDAGYLHVLRDGHNGHNRHRSGVRRRHIVTIAFNQEGLTPDFTKLSVRYESQLTRDRLHALADSLGLSAGSLQRLRLGWDGHAYTFPMSDACGAIVGIRRRFPNGGKASVQGSKAGLFIPVGLTGNGPLLLCEGPTDTAAALDLGFDAIGRPNCSSLVEMTVTAAKDRTEIVVVADGDSAGRAGAQRLAGTLALGCPCVRVVAPPDGVKDLRQWLHAGLSAEVLRQIVASAPTIKLTVAFSRIVPGRKVLL